MKIQGQILDGPNIELLVLPRSGKDIVIRAQAVLDFSSFDELCPAPKPPMKMLKGGIVQPHLEHPGYAKAMESYGTKRMTWMILKSLEATPGLEWETVEMGDPESWENYTQELRDAGFADIEGGRITQCVMAANCLDDARLEEARQRFLASQEAGEVKTEPTAADAPASTPSGEPVSD